MEAQPMIDALKFSGNETLSGLTYEALEIESWAPAQSWPRVMSYRPVVSLTTVLIDFAPQVFAQSWWGHLRSPDWDLPSYDVSTWMEKWWPWLHSFTESVEELRRLPEDWDSYGAARIDRDA